MNKWIWFFLELYHMQVFRFTIALIFLCLHSLILWFKSGKMPSRKSLEDFQDDLNNIKKTQLFKDVQCVYCIYAALFIEEHAILNFWNQNK